MSDGKFVCWSFVGIMVLELGCFVGIGIGTGKVHLIYKIFVLMNDSRLS